MLPTSSRNSGLLSLFLLLLLAFPARAGQVRIDVGGLAGQQVFTPSSVNLNAGDRVVWVWRGGVHSVTSGDPVTACSNGVGDGTFESGTFATNSSRGTTYSWWSVGQSGTIDYTCMPHCPAMSGALHFGTNVAVSDFRITEVQTNIAGNLDLIEITNFGNAAGDLGRYRIVAADTAMVPTELWAVPAGGRVVLHLNLAAAQVPPGTMYLPTQTGLADTGYVALYVPNTINTALADETQMIDFVQWGAAGSVREGTAVSAGLWTAGTFIGRVAAGHSMEFCGVAAEHGANFWAGISIPNFGTAGGCTTAGLPLSWGKLKVMYR